MKKILADGTGCDGNNVYNKVVNYGLKMYNRKQKEAAKAKANADKAKAEADAKIARQKAKKAAKREEQINTQAEAFRRAMQKD
jgi:adenylate kinase